MIFKETSLKGAYIIEIEPMTDERGFFARSFCQKEFEKLDINMKIKQCNISFNKRRGTLRGMHFQIVPHQEGKLVSCTKGSIYDVIIDLRPESITFKRWISVNLNELNRTILYIPEGFAHGFQTIEDNSEVFYHMSEFYHPQSARGIKWDDPTFSIKWPLENKIISEKDREYPLWENTYEK